MAELAIDRNLNGAFYEAAEIWEEMKFDCIFPFIQILISANAANSCTSN